jgi:PhnB protein
MRNEIGMKLGSHLTFSGQCETAFRFYEQCFGGSIVTMLTYGHSPIAEQVPGDWREKIVHASLTVGDTELTGVDLLPKDYETPKGFYVLLNIDTPAETERIFHELSEKGTVKMPIQETFWSVRFGIVVDPFGIPWEINCIAPRQ